jgi:hypothetical protein
MELVTRWCIICTMSQISACCNVTELIVLKFQFFIPYFHLSKSSVSYCYHRSVSTMGAVRIFSKG